MFNEREMSKAIDWLFELFSPEDYEGYDEDEIGYAGGLCLPEVCTALRGAAQTVYQYSVAGGYEKCFNYRGMELFDQRACLIISDVEQAVLDEIKTTYETELWLMEDMNFAIVRCVSMLIGSDDTGYVTEYRAFKKILKNAEDLFFSPEELIEELESKLTIRFSELSDSIKVAEKRMVEIGALQTHINNYSKTRKTYEAYRKSGYSKKFFEEHRDELMLHKAAKQAFDQLEGKKVPSRQILHEEFNRLLVEKKQAYAEYRQVKKEMQEYLIAKQTVETILNIDKKKEQKKEEKKPLR